MKVAHFIWDFSLYNSGRPQRFVSQLGHWLAKMGHNVTVFTSKGGNSQGKGVFETHCMESIDFSDILPLFVCSELQNWGNGLRFFAHILSYNILAASKLVKMNRERNYDVVHLHDWPSVLSAACLKKELDSPFVFQIHSTEKGRSHGLGSKTIEALEYKGMDMADIVVTVSNAMRAELQSLGVNGDKLRVIYNGVDAGKFRPERVSPDLVKKLKEHYDISGETILFTGRLAQVKGVHNLVMAMPEVLKEFPEAKLIILGTGELDAQINFIIEHLGLKDSVILKNEIVDEEERIIHYGI
ncbi:MAG TPA: glycosyltransferase family 1 protein, partial [Archaeoglobaceae archaeon]|nr:glycosyltransferase family 1 protein [Archaeoglobaceae archaeon]